MNELGVITSGAKMPSSTHTSRHVICGINPDGQSAAVYVGDTFKVLDVPGQSVAVLWSSAMVPASNQVPAEGSMQAFYGKLAQAMMPSAGGFTFLRCERAPDAGIDKPIGGTDIPQDKRGDAEFITRPDLHPGMHATYTLDLHVVVSGELTIILEAETLALRAGDSMVVRGVQHAWENRGNVPVVWFCVVVDAMPLTDHRE